MLVVADEIVTEADPQDDDDSTTLSLASQHVNQDGNSGLQQCDDNGLRSPTINVDVIDADDKSYNNDDVFSTINIDDICNVVTGVPEMKVRNGKLKRPSTAISTDVPSKKSAGYLLPSL